MSLMDEVRRWRIQAAKRKAEAAATYVAGLPPWARPCRACGCSPYVCSWLPRHFLKYQAGPPEHLQVTCARCSYSWDEPLVGSPEGTGAG